MSDGQLHPILADTDALIAYARLDCWNIIRSRLYVTTTNVCYRELRNHTNLSGGDKHDPEANARATAAQRVLDALEDDSSTISRMFCGQSGISLGEHSLPPLAKQFPDDVEAILIMDRGDMERGEGGRAYIRRKLDLDALDIELPSLGVPLGILATEGYLTEAQACAEINEIAEKEGWQSRSALERIWKNVPLDCDEEPDFL